MSFRGEYNNELPARPYSVSRRWHALNMINASLALFSGEGMHIPVTVNDFVQINLSCRLIFVTWQSKGGVHLPTKSKQTMTLFFIEVSK